jgi:hypothetical protein
VTGGRQRNATAGFDRLRPRQGQAAAVSAHPSSMAVGRDADGKRVLYSGVRPPPARRATLAVDCARCGQTSTVSLGGALRLLLPSVHLLLPRSRHPSLLRCPACQRISWVRLAVRVATR